MPSPRNLRRLSNHPAPMTRNDELWGCAFAIEREHGPAAFLHAAMRIDELDAQGAREAASVWRAVLERLERLETGSRSRQ